MAAVLAIPTLVDMETRHGECGEAPAAASLVLIGLFDLGVAAGLLLAGWWQAVLLVVALGLLGGLAAWAAGRCAAPLPELEC